MLTKVSISIIRPLGAHIFGLLFAYIETSHMRCERGCIWCIDFIEIENHDLLSYLFYLFSIPHTKPATTHNQDHNPQPQQQIYQSWQPRSMVLQMAIRSPHATRLGPFKSEFNALSNGPKRVACGERKVIQTGIIHPQPLRTCIHDIVIVISF